MELLIKLLVAFSVIFQNCGYSVTGKCITTECKNLYSKEEKCPAPKKPFAFDKYGCPKKQARFLCCDQFRASRKDVDRCFTTECQSVLDKKPKCLYPTYERGFTTVGCKKNYGKYSCCTGLSRGLTPQVNRGSRICELTKCKPIKSKEVKCKGGKFEAGFVPGKCGSGQAMFRCCRYGGLIVPPRPIPNTMQMKGGEKSVAKGPKDVEEEPEEPEEPIEPAVPIEEDPKPKSAEETPEESEKEPATESETPNGDEKEDKKKKEEDDGEDGDGDNKPEDEDAADGGEKTEEGKKNKEVVKGDDSDDGNDEGGESKDDAKTKEDNDEEKGDEGKDSRDGEAEEEKANTERSIGIHTDDDENDESVTTGRSIGIHTDDDDDENEAVTTGRSIGIHAEDDENDESVTTERSIGIHAEDDEKDD